MRIDISKSCVETMLKLGMIQDYTDDGYGFRDDSDWQPLGDIIEFYFDMERNHNRKIRINVTDNKETQNA